MRFPFNEKKAAQAAAHILTLKGGQLSALALIKLLYLSDRKSLIEVGRPITGDRMFCMPHGMVLSMVLDLIHAHDQAESRPWFSYIAPTQDGLVSLRDPASPAETDELSRYEIGVLDEIHRVYGHLTPSQLRNLTHELPEYTDPEGSSIPLDPSVILQNEGRSAEEIREITHEAAEMLFFMNLKERSA